jgi:hypothetical protein
MLSVGFLFQGCIDGPTLQYLLTDPDQQAQFVKKYI